MIPMSEAVVERGYSKMGQIMTKKRTALDGNSLETLMRVSYYKQSLNIKDVKQLLELWRSQKERRIFSSDFKLSSYFSLFHSYLLID